MLLIRQRGRLQYLEGDGNALQVDGLGGAAFPAARVLLKLAAADAGRLHDAARAALLALACYLTLLGECACMCMNIQHQGTMPACRTLHKSDCPE